MSVHISSWVWKESPAAGPDLVMHLALADIARHDCIAWTTVAELMQHTRLKDRKSISRGIKRLVDLGLVSEVPGYVPGRGHQTKGYRLHVPDPVLEKTGAVPQSEQKRGGYAPISKKRGVSAPLPKAGRLSPKSGASEPPKWGVPVLALKELSVSRTEPFPPLPPVPGGESPKARVETAMQGIRERLYREHEILLTRPVERACKRRLTAGVPPESVFAWIAPKPAPRPWDPPEADPAAEAAWSKIRERIKANPNIHLGYFHTWFSPVRGVRITSCPGHFRFRLTLATPTAAFAELLNRNQGNLIRETAQADNTEVLFWRPEAE